MFAWKQITQKHNSWRKKIWYLPTVWGEVRCEHLNDAVHNMDLECVYVGQNFSTFGARMNWNIPLLLLPPISVLSSWNKHYMKHYSISSTLQVTLFDFNNEQLMLPSVILCNWYLKGSEYRDFWGGVFNLKNLHRENLPKWYPLSYYFGIWALVRVVGMWKYVASVLGTGQYVL